MNLEQLVSHLTRIDAQNAPAFTEAKAQTKKTDSDLMLWFARELESVAAKVYEVERPELIGANGDLLPFASDVPDGTDTFVWYTFDARGIAEFKTAYAHSDVPEVTIMGAENTGKVHKMRLSYAWDMDDVSAAAKAGRPLTTRLAAQARRGHDERLHITALWGREELGLEGLFNHRNITMAFAADNGGGSTFWADKTLAQIVEDLATAIDGIDEITNMRLKPNRCLIAHTEYNALKRRKMADGDNIPSTFLAYIESVWPEVEFKPVIDLRESRSRGNLDSDSCFVYRFDADAADLVRPEAFKQLPVERTGYRFIVWTQSSTGGVRMPQPLAFFRIDGIGKS